jgi:hypothetical protein
LPDRQYARPATMVATATRLVFPFQMEKRVALPRVGQTTAGAFVTGAVVGTRVGVAVGILVGAMVGALVGGLVGRDVGVLVGRLVGDWVGLFVGALVGQSTVCTMKAPRSRCLMLAMAIECAPAGSRNSPQLAPPPDMHTSGWLPQSGPPPKDPSPNAKLVDPTCAPLSYTR